MHTYQKTDLRGCQYIQGTIKPVLRIFGELNEEHLRGLMGRAVGRRRGEHIKMIKRGDSQPKHIDSEVWARLVNYESSEQWKEKSEQGKLAN